MICCKFCYRCYKWNLPSVCTMDPPAAGKCCQTPNCPSYIQIQYPSGYSIDQSTNFIICIYMYIQIFFYLHVINKDDTKTLKFGFALVIIMSFHFSICSEYFFLWFLNMQITFFAYDFEHIFETDPVQLKTFYCYLPKRSFLCYEISSVTVKEIQKVFY